MLPLVLGVAIGVKNVPRPTSSGDRDATQHVLEFLRRQQEDVQLRPVDYEVNAIVLDVGGQPTAQVHVVLVDLTGRLDAPFDVKVLATWKGAGSAPAAKRCSDFAVRVRDICTWLMTISVRVVLIAAL